jgi:probable F420-dependent oxidoreductase
VNVKRSSGGSRDADSGTEQEDSVLVSIHLPQLGRLAEPAAVRAAAVAAEEAGYSGVYVRDRLLGPIKPRTPYAATTDGEWPVEQRTALDPIGTLTLAATVTSRVRLGTSVLVGPWYPPMLLARALTTLDLISEGRLNLGLGLGWSIDEYEAVGVPQRHLGARADELLDVLDAAWGSDPVSYTGTRIQIAPCYIDPKPAQKPRPPIVLAARTPPGLDRVARRADGWNPSGLPVDAVPPMWRVIRDMAAAHGRDPDSLRLVVRANIRLTDRALGDDRQTYFGSLEQVADDLAATRELGVHEVILSLYGDIPTVDELMQTYAAVAAAADLRVAA